MYVHLYRNVNVLTYLDRSVCSNQASQLFKYNSHVYVGVLMGCG